MKDYMSHGSSSFLIKDEELKMCYKSLFVEFLHNEGFKHGVEMDIIMILLIYQHKQIIKIVIQVNLLVS